eukprot:CAMPEP_0183306508 /NCGR_PEP_ID=MMETSP0160_2-20130417/12094_1 /TAXON_ID=2839 ORGANISM="Odontella Sinensis, Strain Grunow 1884" /NCGR_SAMPLE_ID=MMETSP0160_2 /ASSEMBLY_ACC=CAM_ASM_000250 /LENGTH=248 /DNA_ID=CAMNT_0025469903 /DNA_START=59 /DNA_END=805 /DNA_ORIENTATION=+
MRAVTAILSLQLLGNALLSDAFAPARPRPGALHRTAPLTLPPSSSLLRMVDGGIADSAAAAWSSYNAALESDPLLVKSVTAGVILGAADFAGQALERKQKESAGVETGDVDLARAARFAFFGLVLQAPWNHFYYLMLDGALPPTEEPWTATTGIKVVIDQFVQAPVFTVLIFLFLGLLEGKTVEAVQTQLEADYKDTMVANWKLWVPATVVNIAFVPPILRVLYLNSVFFFWSIFLSLKLNKDEEVSQ